MMRIKTGLGLACIAFVLSSPALASDSFADFRIVNLASMLAFKAAGGSDYGGSLFTQSAGNINGPVTSIPTLFDIAPLSGSSGTVDFPQLNVQFTLTANTSEAAIVMPPVKPGKPKALLQYGLSGSFSFIYTGPDFDLNGRTYGSQSYRLGAGPDGLPGLHLLYGTFSDAMLTGTINASSGSVMDATDLDLVIPNINFQSDVLDFNRDALDAFSLALTSVSPKFSVVNGKLQSFVATASGNFSSDPSPTIRAVPEASTWAMMLIGFAGMGGAIRLRRRDNASLAPAQA